MVLVPNKIISLKMLGFFLNHPSVLLHPLHPPDIPRHATTVFLLCGCFQHLVLTGFLEEVLTLVSQRCRSAKEQSKVNQKKNVILKSLQQTDLSYKSSVLPGQTAGSSSGL